MGEQQTSRKAMKMRLSTVTLKLVGSAETKYGTM